jgi:prevent-host-death family protein
MQVNMHEAKTQLSKLVERAAAGEEVVIAKAGVPRVRLVPVEPKRKSREPGLLKGQIWISPDFDERDEEIERLFSGDDE